jgi:hypothetical protein
LTRPPVRRVLDPPALREPEVPALADDPAAQVGPVDPHGVVGLVTDVAVGLASRLHVRADPAVPQQVDGRAQEHLDELGGREPHGVDAERRAHLRRDRDGLGGAGEHPAALRDPAAVVVGPRGAREREQPAALGVARGRIGVRVEEDVAVVERAEQPDVLRQQHPVAEDVAAHVPDADDGEVRRLDVDVQLTEVAGHRLPRAARGDAHRLVVVAGRPARGERVPEPEAAVARDGVGDVEKLAVPLSAATTRYGSSPSWRTTSCGGTTAPSASVSVRSSRAPMNVR